MTPSQTPPAVAPATAADKLAAARAARAALTARVVRGSKITIHPDAPHSPYGEGRVTTGSRKVGDTDEDLFVIVDGSQRIAFPQSAVAELIIGAVIPADKLAECIALRDQLALAA